MAGALGGVLGCLTYKRLVQSISGGVLNIINGRTYKYILKTAFVDFTLGAIIGIISGNGLGTKYLQKGSFHKGHLDGKI